MHWAQKLKEENKNLKEENNTLKEENKQLKEMLVKSKSEKLQRRNHRPLY
jgi:cell division protein FtsB